MNVMALELVGFYRGTLSKDHVLQVLSNTYQGSRVVYALL